MSYDLNIYLKKQLLYSLAKVNAKFFLYQIDGNNIGNE